MDNRTVRGAQQGQPIRRPAPGGQPPRRPAPSGGAPGSRPPQKQPGRNGGSRWVRALVMVLATIGLCGFFALFILQSANDLLGLNQEDNQIEVVIPEGASIQQIASLLQKAGVVDQQATFILYAGIQVEEGELQPGNYAFNSNMGYDQLITAMKTGNSKKEVVTITFIEGWSVYEIAKALEGERVCDANEFLDFLQTEDMGFEFMDQLPTSTLRFRRLEGYLFPDTYEFYVGEKVDSVARKFLRNFDSKVTQSMRDQMLDMNLSLDETITLASIIQKEAGGVGGIEEMKRVSSVLHNRLELSAQYPRLQSDVTLIYVNNFIIPFQDTRDQPMYDAYNTYEREGLPIAPICNPGLNAIEAALNPADTPFYFFVTDVQEQFYYAVTLQEHNANVIQASSVEGEGEIHGTGTK